MLEQAMLPGGLRIVGERIPHFRSVSVGLWVGAGSQFECAAQGGVSHFIEHMLFKGTEKRSARQIAEAMDAVGGQLNAFTAKECTCYYARVVDEHLPLAMDVLSDMLTASLFREEDIEREKGVVLEEINMAEDNPEDVVSELIMLARYGEQPLARPILGTPKTLTALTREDILSYFDRMYRPDNCVLAVAGHYDWDEVLELAGKYFGSWARGEDPLPVYRTAPFAPGSLRRQKDVEQLHLCLGYPGVAWDDEALYPLSLVNSVFGGANSSRLFQSIREDRGLAYSVYSYPASYRDTGALVVYAGVAPRHADAVLNLMGEEARKLAEEGMSRSEFEQARAQMRAGYILGLESTSSRMSAMGRRLLLQGAPQSEEEVLQRIDGITYEKACEAGRAALSAQPALALVGRDL